MLHAGQLGRSTWLLCLNPRCRGRSTSASNCSPAACKCLLECCQGVSMHQGLLPRCVSNEAAVIDGGKGLLILRSSLQGSDAPCQVVGQQLGSSD